MKKMKLWIQTPRSSVFKRKRNYISPLSGDTVTRNNPSSNIFNIQTQNNQDSSHTVDMSTSRTSLSPIIEESPIIEVSQINEESPIQLESSENKTQHLKLFLWPEAATIEHINRFQNTCIADVDI